MEGKYKKAQTAPAQGYVRRMDRMEVGVSLVCFVVALEHLRQKTW